MGERGQKGKEGLRMQPYCVSWRDLVAEALVLRSVLRPYFRLLLQHLPSSPSPLSASYHIELPHDGALQAQKRLGRETSGGKKTV